MSARTWRQMLLIMLAGAVGMGALVFTITQWWSHSPRATVARADAAEGRGDYRAALSEWDKAIQGDPNEPGYHFGRAVVLGKLDRHTEALAEYDIVVKLAPSGKLGAMGWNNRAWELYLLKRYIDGLGDANRSLKLDPDNANARDTRACIFAGLGRYAEAVNDEKKAVALAPHNRDFQTKLEEFQKSAATPQ